MSDRIGFIGLGIMGRPLALNLVKGGYQPKSSADLDSNAVLHILEQRLGVKLCEVPIPTSGKKSKAP